MDRRRVAANDEVVYALTEKGAVALHEPGTSLLPTDLEVLVLIDGRAAVSQVMKSVPGLAAEEVRQLLRKLLQHQLIELVDKSSSELIDAEGFFRSDTPAGPSDDGEAALGVSSLRQQGYFVRIARRTASAAKAVEGGKISILAVEDDADLCKLLRSYLTLEGYALHTAASREEIVAALRRSERPDLVLLDVTLPDANGFEVLAALRRHPALNSVPVIMLTGKATREAVLKGLASGADGYVTKPFEMDVLVDAMKAVLGWPAAAGEQSGTEYAARPQGGVDAEYRDRVLEKLARLETLRADLASGEAPAARIADLHREAHTIAGSAGLFGLGSAGTAARALEQFLEPYRAGDEAPGPDGRARIKVLLESIRRAAQGR